ncbi:hypothetical protein WICPIJ_009943 [Wickerhamomyces pijperi]|uniref:CS domain-containing protein n=1 Tax=Wickerhamomyces pijperi TaxID=599730 RepID=A0A9P8PJ56_WICPI|nr:hypothetical protein WICPIJ_009943 [Wickerhamomyces pijperi]
MSTHMEGKSIANQAAKGETPGILTNHFFLVLWAQRSNATEASKNIIYLTIRTPNANSAPKISLTSTQLNVELPEFTPLTIDFFKKLNVDESKYTVSQGKSISFILRKEESQEEFWPRLTKEKLKYHYIKTDFDKWVDEDEQDEEEEQEDDQFANMAGMGGMGGQGGANGMPDMSAMMAAMGGAGGAGGAGGMPDLASMMSGMGGSKKETPNLTADDIPAINDDTPGFGDFDLAKLAELNPELKKFQRPDGSFDLDAINDDLKLEEQKLNNDEDDEESADE